MERVDDALLFGGLGTLMFAFFSARAAQTLWPDGLHPLIARIGRHVAKLRRPVADGYRSLVTSSLLVSASS